MASEYSLYTLKELVAEIDSLFTYNNNFKTYLGKAYRTFLKKYPLKNEVFNLSSDTDNAIHQTLRLIEAIEELKRNIPKIKTQNFGGHLVQHFNEIGSEAQRLYFYHRKSFHENEEEWNDIRILPEEDQDLIRKWFYAETSDFIQTMKLLVPIGMSLERYAKEAVVNIKTPKNNFNLKNLKNDDDAFEDFEDRTSITSKKYGGFELYTDNRVTYGGKSFDLEAKQWKLLYSFLEHANTLLGIDTIVFLLDDPVSIQVQSNKKDIAKLNKRLEKETGKIWITNKRERGWIFNL